jgi:hypothetical protein
MTLLSGGQTVYTGPVSSVLPYFDAQFLPCPPHVNPADHLIDISTLDLRTPALESASTSRVTNLLQSWTRSQLTSSAGAAAPSQAPPPTPVKAPGVPLWRQTWYLTKRNFWITIRDPFGLGGFLFEAIIIGTVVGWIFLKIPGTLTGIRSMQGFIYTVLGLQGYLLLLFTTWKVSVDMKVSPRWKMLRFGFLIGRDRTKCTLR